MIFVLQRFGTQLFFEIFFADEQFPGSSPPNDRIEEHAFRGSRPRTFGLWMLLRENVNLFLWQKGFPAFRPR
jgi:hypothetical protein